MAFTAKTTLLCVTLVLVFISTTAPKANALIINGLPVNTLSIAAITRCSAGVTDSCTTCAPLSNIAVAITLRGSQIATATTGPDGSFKVNIDVGNTITSLGDIDNMRVSVTLPIANCSIWATVPTTGRLEGTLALQPATSILGGVAPLLVSVLTLVT